jgi:hypothetical protein
MPRGGYRKPNNPAPVSGPGALSRRTDGGPVQAAKEMSAGGKYGERKALQELQQSAPMQGNSIPSVPTPSISAPRTPVTNLFAPTERPNEPITAGAPTGAGRTPEPVGQYAMIEKYMPQLDVLASRDDSPESFKIFLGLVKNIISEGK